jgi:hypothetical protein
MKQIFTLRYLSPLGEYQEVKDQDFACATTATLFSILELEIEN